MKVASAALGVLCALAMAASAHAHATYNISGYGSGIGGSTNGADGMPADGTASWTNGPVADYTGNLPVMWYAGMHSTTQVRTIQSGVAPNPPSGSLLQQTNSYNTANDPDYPTDRVLAVGGLSWTDPGNGDQGWGHGLDYGLIHFSPIDTLLASGPVKFTITVTDDPSDGVAPRLAFALYGGWDTSATSSRHQTFTSNPTPVNNPLGSTGLTLIDYGVATAGGQTLSRTYQLDATYGGEYTLFIGALGGVAGEYQVTITTAPDASLAVCEDALAAATVDTDGDGVIDASDDCPSTPASTAVDALGCSRAEFCATFDVSTKAGLKACKKADWNNDEPVMTKKTQDCVYDKLAAICAATTIP